MDTTVAPPRTPLRPLVAPQGIGPGLPAGPASVAPRRTLAANATIASRVDVTDTMARFTVRPDAGAPQFRPGQYFALGMEVDGQFLQRPYSTASTPGAEELEFLIKRVSAGVFTPRLWAAAPGDRVWIGPPRGLFTLTPNDPRSHLLVSSGTGLAPFISMATELVAPGSGVPSHVAGAEMPLRAVVLHGVSYVPELAYRDRLETWASTGRLEYVPTVSRPSDPANDGWAGAVGRVESVLDRVCDRLQLEPMRTIAYLCGNPDMIEAVTETLRRRGFSESAIVRELYWTESTGSR
jgi:ferredoxin/flavodoxin---NADP+ reductase